MQYENSINGILVFSKSLKNSVVEGSIEGFCEGDLTVRVSYFDGVKWDSLIAVCTPREQVTREEYRLGTSHSWYVRDVALLRHNTGNYYTRVSLSRSAWELPEILLGHAARQECLCINRIPGAISSIITTNRVSQVLIRDLVRQLSQEKVNIFYGKLPYDIPLIRRRMIQAKHTHHATGRPLPDIVRDLLPRLAEMERENRRRNQKRRREQRFRRSII